MAGDDEQLICASAELIEGGNGVRFTLEHDGMRVAAFALRSEQQVHAYLNRCTHRATELDWEPGRFFDLERRYLICATHGALYHPRTGGCVGGPCNGGLVKLVVIEKNSAIYLVSSSKTRDR